MFSIFSKASKRKQAAKIRQLKERKQAREAKISKEPIEAVSITIEDLSDGSGVWCVEDVLLQSDKTDNSKLVSSYQRLIKAFPPLPATWDQLQRALDDGASAQRIAELIVSEPELAAELLRTVNSAGFGVIQEVSNVNQAVVLLGYNMVKNIAAKHHLAVLGGQGEGLYSTAELWRHSMVVSTLAMEIAKLIPHCNPGEAATMGLLHDIGRMFLHDLSTRKDFKVKAEFEQQCMQQGGYLLFEMKTFGCTHLELGLLLAEHWQLPEKIRHAIAFHHHPTALDASLVPESSRLEVLAVALANMLAIHAGYIGGNPCKSLPHESYHDILKGVAWTTVLDDTRVQKELRRIKHMRL